MISDELIQKATCSEWGSPYLAVDLHAKVGISANVRDGLYPINGLRHRPMGDTSGWYIWAGEELSDAVDFFLPLHIEHLEEWCPGVGKFLALSPGWRFLLAPNYEDVWFDPSLLTD